MSDTDTTADTAADTAAAEVDLGKRPAAPTSVLTSLRDRKKAVVDALHLDLPVPRMEPAVIVRFKPVDDGVMNGIGKRFEKSKATDKQVRLNATALATHVVGVFQLDADGTEVSIDPDNLHGDWPTFDERLGELLGMDPEFAKTPVNVVLELYATDGDVIATAAKLGEWSGYTIDVEERAGN